MPCRVCLVVAFIALAVTPVAASAQADSSSSCTDTLASGGGLRGSALRRLTIDDARQAFVLIPGTLFRAGGIGVSTAPDIAIRGGVPGSASTYIDGAPVRFQTLGTQGIGIAENAIADVCITTGVAAATVADVTGGVVSYVTRTGGDRLSGGVRWESDDPFGNRVSVGYNRIEGSVGGPLPIAPNVSFFLSATLQGQLSRYRSAAAASVPAYVPVGVDTVADSVTVPRFVQWSGECSAASNGGAECQGLRRPMDWATARRIHGKIQHTYGAASLLSFTFLGSEFQQRSFPGQLIMDPALYGGGRERSAVAIANWRHQIGALRGSPLTLDVNLSYGRNDQISGPLRAASETATREPTLGIEMGTLEFTGLDVFPLPVTDRLVRNVRTNTGLRVPYQNRPDLVNRQPYRLNPFGVWADWPTEGVNALLSFVSERRWQGRAGLTWVPTAAQRVTVGIDAERTSLSKYQSGMLNQSLFDAFVEQPSRVGVFASDRMSLGRAVLDLGVRLDRIAPGGEFSTTPGRIYTHPAWLPGADTSDALYASNVASVFTKVGSQIAFSPRIRLAYPVSANTSVRLGYGRSVEAPAWATFFQNANADGDFASSSLFFGRDVKFAMVSQLDVGVRSALGRDVTIDVGAYLKDLPRYVGRFRPFADPLNPGDTINVNVLSVDDSVSGIGLDTRLDWRVGDWLTASGAYSLLRASRGDAGVTTHAVAAVATLQVPTDGPAFARDLTAQLSLRATSGLPYTRLINAGSGAIAPGPLNGTMAEPINASHLPWSKRLDLRLAKAVHAGGRAWTVYADVRNALNFRNVIALFAETGGVTNDEHRVVALSNEYLILKNEASNSGALEPDGATVNLTACGAWANPVNCVALTRVERRFGDGNGLYTLAEQDRALNAYYDGFMGPARFYESGRTLRIGVELEL